MLSIRALIVGLATAGLGLSVAAASRRRAGAPTCTPATLNTSAIKAGLVTVSPLSGSRDADAQTQISFLGVPAAAIADVRVVGSQSGAHAGRLLAYSQGDGASFVPARPFAEGERVTVRATVRSGGRVAAAARQLRDRRAGPDHAHARRRSIRARAERSAELRLAPGPAPAAGDGDRAVAGRGAGRRVRRALHRARARPAR